MHACQGYQLATDAWKRKGVNDGEKLTNYVICIPSGGSHFYGVTSNDGSSMTGERMVEEFETMLKEVRCRLLVMELPHLQLLSAPGLLCPKCPPDPSSSLSSHHWS